MRSSWEEAEWEHDHNTPPNAANAPPGRQDAPSDTSTRSNNLRAAEGQQEAHA